MANAAKDSGLGTPAMVLHSLTPTGTTGHTPRWQSSGAGPDPLKEEQSQGQPANQLLQILHGSRISWLKGVTSCHRHQASLQTRAPLCGCDVVTKAPLSVLFCPLSVPFISRHPLSTFSLEII